MTNDNWNPGHWINKQYPHDGVLSRNLFKNRPTIVEEDGKPGIIADPKVFTDRPSTESFDPDNKWIGFLLSRLFDFSESLKAAEDQIDAMLEEHPFIPEQLNFEVIAKNREPKDPPMRIYGAKCDDRFCIFPKPGLASDPEWDPTMWVIQKKEEDETIKTIEVKIPCRRIAYALFYSLGVNMIPEHVTEQ